MCVPSMTASGLPSFASKSATSAWCEGQPALVVPGEDGHELRRERLVHVGGHGAEEARGRGSGDPGRNRGPARAHLDERTREGLQELIDVERCLNLRTAQDEHEATLLGANARENRTVGPPELELVPGRHGRDLEQGALTLGVLVGEVAVSSSHVTSRQVLLDAVVEPCAPKDELAEPVDERLVVHESQPLPLTDDVLAERRSAGRRSAAARRARRGRPSRPRRGRRTRPVRA